MRKFLNRGLLLTLFSIFFLSASFSAYAQGIMVFSKTAGFRHGSIGDGITMIQNIASANGWTVTATENSADFNASNLANFDVVVWLSTTGDVLGASEQTAFENYITGGGGYLGIHAASDTEYGWSWYGTNLLAGAYFANHPSQQNADVLVEDQSHQSTSHLPATWSRFDEWYNFQANPRSSVNVLAALDESTYSGGSMGDHPIAWYIQ